jgi:hypothetical protein
MIAMSWNKELKRLHFNFQRKYLVRRIGVDMLYCLQKLSFGKEDRRDYTIELYLNETLINGKSTG